jgi:hypothetical protein
MKKIFTSLLALGFLWINGYSQVYVDETFETDIPSTWTTTSTGPGTPEPWFWNDGLGFQTLNGTGYARVDSDADGNGNHMIEDLESPGFDASGGNIIVLQFEQRYQAIGSDSATVQVWNGTVWNDVIVYTTTQGNWNDPDNVTLIITDFVNPSGDTKVRFHYDDANVWAWMWAIDNVEISSVDCLEPLNVSIQPGAIAAIVSWDSGSGTSDIVFGPVGVDPADLAGTGGTQVDDASNPYTVTGLDPETTYEVWLRDDCGSDGDSPWAGPFSYTTTVACPTPSVTTWNAMSDITSTSATIAYTQNGLGDMYVVIGPEDFLPGDPDSDTIPMTSNPFTITGLSPLSFYSAFVFMDCEGDDLGTSDNSATVSFNTLTDAAGTSCGDPFVLSNANMPYTSVGQSICGYGNNVTSPTCNFGGYDEIVYVYAPETADEVLGIYGANSTTETTVYFSITTACPDSAGAECVAGGFWDSGNDPTYLLTTAGNDLTVGQTYYITVSGGTFNGCLIDLQIFVIDCNTPSNLSYVNYPDSTVLTWDFVNDSTTNWQVVWGIEGFDPGTEGTTVSGTYENGQTSATLTLTGLSDTVHYEFYVTDECGFNNVSIPAGPAMFVGPPPVNDLCVNATTIECGETLTGSNITANDEGNSTNSCNGWDYPQGPTVWYTFEGTGDEITLNTCGTDWNTAIYVYTGECGDSLVCSASATGNFYLGEYQCGSGNFDPSFVSIQSEAGVTYTVAIAAGTTWQPPTGQFFLTMECIPCSSPYELEVLTVSNEAALLNWQTFNEGDTYTYEYGFDGFTPGSGIGGGTGVVGTDGPPLTISGLLADTTYQFYVFEECAVGSTDTLFTSFTTNLEAPPANDLCENAQVIACGESDTSSLTYATTFGNTLDPICGTTFDFLNVSTIWYQLEGTGQEMNLSTCGSNVNGTGNFYAELALFTGECGALECEAFSNYDYDLDCGLNPYSTTSFSFYGEEGVTYYVAFTATSSFYTQNSQTVLNLECIDCSVPYDLSASVTDVTAALSWSTFNLNTTYTLAWDSAGFDYPTEPGNVVTGNNSTDVPVELSGLEPGGTYTFYVTEFCESIGGNSDTVSFTFTTYPEPPPANDDICNAVALTAGDTLATTNQYASTQAGEPVPNGGSCNDPDQLLWCNNNLNSTTWYTFTPDMDGMTTISTCYPGNFFDSQLAVYKMDDCDGFVNWELVAANDDYNPCDGGTTLSSTVTLCLEGGVTYYIQVDPYSTPSEWTPIVGQPFYIWVDFDGGEVMNEIAFPTPHTASINFDYMSTLGVNVDYTLFYTNTVTNEEMMVTGNTADLPIVIDGLDDATMYDFYISCGDACNTTSEVSSFTTLLDGINELGFGKNVNVYPNPATDKITVEINAEVSEGSVISIVSLQGKVIYSEVVKENTTDYRTEIDVDNYARGIYLLKLEDENSSIQQRIIVQ